MLSARAHLAAKAATAIFLFFFLLLGPGKSRLRLLQRCHHEVAPTQHFPSNCEVGRDERVFALVKSALC